jgi:cytosine/adenosine deaminase-related metal-dependent hydrolase
MSKRTLIKNGTIVTVDPAIGDLAKGDLLIEDGRIAQVAPQIDAGADAEVIDASDRLVLPGMVDTHRHTWQALFRNIGSDWTLAHYLSGLHDTVSGLYRAVAGRGRRLDRADAPLLGAAARRHGAPAARAQEGPQVGAKGS